MEKLQKSKRKFRKLIIAIWVFIFIVLGTVFIFRINNYILNISQSLPIGIYQKIDSYDYKIDDSVIYIIDKNIPYHILFVFEYNNKKKYSLSYKEISREAETINIQKIFHSDWLSEDEDLLKFSGISLDDMYENLLNSISNNELNRFSGDTLKERVLNSIDYEKIQNYYII